MLQIEDYKKYMLTQDNINKNYCNFLHNNENMKNYNKKNEKYNTKCTHSLLQRTRTTRTKAKKKLTRSFISGINTLLHR